ncbi:MAG: hypothetical protein HXS40_06375 [Theionarchaea archaeon]|nr:hypothetical protein [Theionarchaea archaeon]
MNILSKPQESRHEEVLFTEQDIEVTPAGFYRTINYSIPKDAPFTFQDVPSVIKWGVHVLVKKSRFFKESAFQQFVVLPHVLESESPPPLDIVPIPTSKYSLSSHFSIARTQMWRSFGPFSKSAYLDIQLEESAYSPRDTIAGNVHFSRNFEDAVLSVYLVLVKKAKALWKPGEKEYLKLRTTDTFRAESRIPFSFSLSPLSFPEFETEHSKMYWKIRAVVSRPLHIGKYAECYIRIKPLEF